MKRFLLATLMVGAMAIPGTAMAYGGCGPHGRQHGSYGHQTYYRAPVYGYGYAPYGPNEYVYPGGVAPYRVGYASPGFSFWFGR